MENENDDQNAKVEVGSSNRQRLCEPDVTVVVGGVEFRHFSQLLSSYSNFFDAAFHLGMKEDQEKRVVLSGDWDPAEWEEVAQFFDPSRYVSNPPSITQENIRMLLRWFQYLEMTDLLKGCERFLRAVTLKDGNICSRQDSTAVDVPVAGFSGRPELSLRQSELFMLCDSYDICLRFGLEDLMEDLLPHLENAIEQSPDFFTLESVTVLVSAMGADSVIGTESNEALWTLIKEYLPQNIHEAHSNRGIDTRTLLTNELLPNLILYGMNHAVLAVRDRWFPGTFSRSLFSADGYNQRRVEGALQESLRAFDDVAPRETHNG